MTVSFFIFLLVIVANQFLHQRAQAKLSADQKAIVMDVWSKRGPWPLLAVAVIFGFQSLLSDYLDDPDWILPVFIALLLASTLAFAFADLRRLTRMGLPPSYIQSVRINHIITNAALIVFFGTILYD